MVSLEALHFLINKIPREDILLEHSVTVSAKDTDQVLDKIIVDLVFIL